MTAESGAQGGTTKTAAEQAAVRAWFNEHGWQLEPADLRHALQERGADDDLIVELLDEGADRRRTQPQPVPDRTRRNGAAPVPDQSTVPPQNLEAEESVLGAMMISPGAIAACREILDPAGGEFYRDSHRYVWRAALSLADQGEPVDAITLTDQLEQTPAPHASKAGNMLEEVGGRVRLHELAALVPATANVAHYARIVADTAALRGLISAGGEVSRLGWERPGDTGDLLEQARSIIETATRPALDIQVRDRLVAGGAFVLDQPDTGTLVWGSSDDEVAWAAGEGLMVAGPQGVGKTTLMQQLALARIGFRAAVLGMQVAPDERKVLYIAADRPRQVQRSLARMVSPEDRELLDERLIIHRGPPLPLITTDTSSLARLAERAGAGTVIVDSLKDVAVKLADDDYGGRINLAFQALIGDGIELLVGHHQRKASTDNKKPNKLDDVYGSTWITSGLGSVLLLWGEPGDAIVELSHLKQPREELGPWNILHDHARGVTSRASKPELVDLLFRAATDGLTATAATELVLEKDTPTRNEVEKTRRKLERLVESERAVKLPGSRGTDAPRYLYNGGTQDTLQ